MIEPPPFCLELGHAVLEHEEDACEVDGDDLVPVVAGRVDDAEVVVAPQHAGVVVDDVELAELGDAALDAGLDLRLVGDVGHEAGDLAAVALDEGDRLVERLLVDLERDDLRAVLGEEPAGLPALAHPRARDERYLAFESAAHSSPPVACVPVARTLSLSNRIKQNLSRRPRARGAALAAPAAADGARLSSRAPALLAAARSSS